MSYYGGGRGGWGPPPNVGAPPGQPPFYVNQGQMPPQQQPPPVYFHPDASALNQAQGGTQYLHTQAGYGYGMQVPPTVPAPGSSTAQQPSQADQVGMGSMGQSAQYSFTPSATQQTSSGDVQNRARSSRERSRNSYSPPRRRSPSPDDDRHDRRSSGNRDRDDKVENYMYRSSGKHGRESSSKSPEDDRHYSMESRSRQDIRKSRRDGNSNQSGVDVDSLLQDERLRNVLFSGISKATAKLEQSLKQEKGGASEGLDVDSLLQDERLRNVLFSGISKATAKLEQSLKQERGTNDSMAASEDGAKSHLFPSASTSTGFQQKPRSILKRKPHEASDAKSTFSQLSTLEKTLHMLRGKPDTNDSPHSGETSRIKADSKSHGALGQLVSYDDDNDEESFLYGDKKESSSETKKKPSAVHPFWSVNAVNVSADKREPDTFEMKDKMFEKWRQSIQKPSDSQSQSISPKEASKDRDSRSATSHVPSVSGNKDGGQEELDSTVQNILQSIGFDFDLSQRMQQLARKKKFQDEEESTGISNQTASFLGKGHNLSEELKASLLSSGNDLSQIDNLLQEARASARHNRGTGQRGDSSGAIDRGRRDRSPDDQTFPIKRGFKGRQSPSEWSDQEDEMNRPSRRRPIQDYEQVLSKEGIFNKDRMVKSTYHITKSLNEEDVRDEYFYPEKDPVDMPPGVPLLTSYSSRQKDEDLSSGLLKSMRVENFRVMSRPVYDDDGEEFAETRRIILPAKTDRKVIYSRSPSAGESRSPSERGNLKRLGSPLSASSLKERRIISDQSGHFVEERLKSSGYDRYLERISPDSRHSSDHSPDRSRRRESISPSYGRKYSSGYRSPSPRDFRGSPTFKSSRRSPSPRFSRRSPSPRGSRRSPSPRGSRRSPSPRDSRRSPSPRGPRRSPSPRGSRRSPSPRGSRRSPLSRGSRRLPSPRGFRRSPTSRGYRRSPFPRGSRYRYRPGERSRSPDHRRPRSPRRYRSRSPIRSRSRSPRRQRSRSRSNSSRFRVTKSPLRGEPRPTRTLQKKDIQKSDSKNLVNINVKGDGINVGKTKGQAQNLASVDCSKMTDEERKNHLQKMLAEKNKSSNQEIKKSEGIDYQNILESFEKLVPTISIETKADMIKKLSQLPEKDRSKVSTNVNERFAKVMTLKFELVKLKKQQNELMRKSQRSGKGKGDPELSSNEKDQLSIEREIVRLSALDFEVEVEVPKKNSDNLVKAPVSASATSKSGAKAPSSKKKAASSVSKNVVNEKNKAPPSVDILKAGKTESDTMWKTVNVEDVLPNITDGGATKNVDKTEKPSKSAAKNAATSRKKIYYEYIDSGNHFCRHCHVTCKTLSQFFEHIHGKKHARAISGLPSPWEHKKAVKTENRKVGQAQSRRVKGTEMMFPVTGSYCCLCKFYCEDYQIAEKHLKSDIHYDKYLDYIRDNPMYEKNLLLEKTKIPQDNLSDGKNSPDEENDGKSKEKKAHLRVKADKEVDEDSGAFDKFVPVDMELDDDDEHRDDDKDVESKVPKMVPKPPPPFVPPPPPEPPLEDSMKTYKEDEVQPLDKFLTIKPESTDKGAPLQGEKIPVVKSRAAVDLSKIPMPPVTKSPCAGKARSRDLVTVKSLKEVQDEEYKAQEAERKAMDEEKRMMGIDVDAEEEKLLAPIKRPPMLQNLPANPSEAAVSQKEPVKPPTMDSLFAKLNKSTTQKRKLKPVSLPTEKSEMEMRIQQEIEAKISKEKEKLARKKQKEEERKSRREERQLQKKRARYSDSSSSEYSDSEEEENASEVRTAVSVENEPQTLSSEIATAEATGDAKSRTEAQTVPPQTESGATSINILSSTDITVTNVGPVTEGMGDDFSTSQGEHIANQPQENVPAECLENISVVQTQKSVIKELQTKPIAESKDGEGLKELKVASIEQSKESDTVKEHEVEPIGEAKEGEVESKEINLTEPDVNETIGVETSSEGAETKKETKSISPSQGGRKGRVSGKKKKDSSRAVVKSESDLFGVFSSSSETVSRDAKKKLTKKGSGRKLGRGGRTRQLHEEAELEEEGREIDMENFVVLSELMEEEEGMGLPIASDESKQQGGEDQELFKVQLESSESAVQADHENLLNTTSEFFQPEDVNNENANSEAVDVTVETTSASNNESRSSEVIDEAAEAASTGETERTGSEVMGAVEAPSMPLDLENNQQDATIELHEVEGKQTDEQPTEPPVPAAERGGRRARGRKSGGRGRGRGKRGGKSQRVVDDKVSPEPEKSENIAVEVTNEEEANSTAESKVEGFESSSAEPKVEETENGTGEETRVQEVESSSIESTKVQEVDSSILESAKRGETESSTFESTQVEGEIEPIIVGSRNEGEIESSSVTTMKVDATESGRIEEITNQNDASPIKTDDKERRTGKSTPKRARRGRAAATSGRVTRSRLCKKQSERVEDEGIVGEEELVEAKEEKEPEVIASPVTPDETDCVNMTSLEQTAQTFPGALKDSTNEEVVAKDGSDSDATLTEDTEDIAVVSQISSSFIEATRTDHDTMAERMQDMFQVTPEEEAQSADTSQGQTGIELLEDQTETNSDVVTMGGDQMEGGIESSSWNPLYHVDLGQESFPDLPAEMPVLQEFVPHHLPSPLPNQPRDPPMSGIVSEMDTLDTVMMDVDEDEGRQEGHVLECDYDEGLPTSGLSLGLEVVSDSMSFPLEDDNTKTDCSEPLSSE